MGNSNHDVTLRFILDEAAQQRVEKGASTLAQELEKIGVSADDIKRAKFGDQVASEVDKAAKATKEKLNPALVDTKKVIKEARAEAALLRAQVAAMQSDLEKARIAQIRQAAGLVQGIGTRALATGAAVSGGIFLAAKNYIKDAEQSDRLTQKWLASTQEIERAQERIGRVAAQTVLPFLEKAADVSSQVAGFVEKHPEIVEAAFNTGVFVAGFGALAIAVSKGIKLVADIKYLATLPIQLEAARLQDIAADKQLIAAQAKLKELGVDIPGGGATKPGGAGGLLAGLTSPAGIVTLIAATGAASVAAADNLKKLEERLIQIGGPAAAPFIGFLDTVTQTVNPLIPAIKNLRQAFERDFPRIRQLIEQYTGINLGGQTTAGGTAGVSAVASLGGNLATSASRDQVVAAWEKWQAEDARIVQQAAERRVQIVKDAENRIAAATAQFASRVTSINTAADRRAADLTANFLQANAEAEAQYQAQRAQAIEDGNQEIRDIQEAHQERLRQMEQDHNERVEDLTSSRDALGLAKEQRRFNQERAEENRSTRLEIAKRRADLAERLADLARQNEAERAQRLAQYQQALAENEAQRKEQLKEAAAAFAEEQRQIREQRAQQLRELQEGLNAERIRRREVFIEQIRDLDASLLGERSLRVQRYNEMLSDVDRFLADYRTRLASIGTATPPTGFAIGGYASGIVRTGEQGVEYILSNRTTRAAESIIGGRLTQDSLLNALARGGSSRRSLTINDHSRFDGRISAAQVRAIKQETIGEIARELG
jgi:hypothetical protein